MIIKKELIQKLADYVLLNACSVASPGLYNGKVGLSLALFEAARYLHDNYIEDEAFHHLQEALLTPINNTNFENGTSGIGWALLYLIDNRFVDADFDGMFEEQYEKIVTSFNQIESKPYELLQTRQTIYFLSAVIKQKPHDKRIFPIIQSLFEALEVYLSVHFFDLADMHYTDNKPRVLRIFESYLRLAHYACYPAISHSVLKDYATIYRQGKFVKSYCIGHFMEKVLDCDRFKCYKDVIVDNKKDVGDTSCSTVFSLHESINRFQLQGSINCLTEWDGKSNLFLVENQLTHSIPSNVLFAGYQSGVSRYLIYIINNNATLL